MLIYEIQTEYDRTETFVFQAALQEMRAGVFSGGGDRQSVSNIGVLVSDGYSTVNASRTLPEAQLAKAEDITMLSVIVNPDHNFDDMAAIASDPTTDLFFLTNSSQLALVVEQTLDLLCSIAV